ncbi:MAG: hypothetical protein WBE13_02605 [Candidatus Acidiferrum sp.]
MNAKQAKDFLAQQTAEQAALEGVPFSDLEKRMMYFTESDSSCENPVELNEEFEEQFDTQEYEAKISRLLHHALDRLKREDPEKTQIWDQSIRTLREGDHYILVLWDIKTPGERRPRDSFKLLALGLLIAAGLITCAFLAAKYNISLDRFRKHFPAPNPRLALILYVGFILLAWAGFSLFNKVLIAWYRRRSSGNKKPR